MGTTKDRRPIKFDPSGLTDQIEQINPDQLSAHDLKIAAGIALLREGKTYRAAADAVGVSAATLWRHAHGISQIGRDVASRSATEQALLDASFDLAQMAAHHLAERIMHEGATMKVSDLNKVYGTATDKIAQKLGWSRGVTVGDDKTQDALAGALQALRGGAEVSIRQPDPVSQAIDVQGERIGEDSRDPRHVENEIDDPS